MFEQTLAIMKPSVIKRGIEGDIFEWYGKSGLEIASVKIIRPDERFWINFYKEHDGKPFFPKHIEFMTSGISLGLRIEGEDAVRKIRVLNGATDPNNAEAGTIRRIFASGNKMPDNAVHGSASRDDARRELALVFGPGCLI